MSINKAIKILKQEEAGVYKGASQDLDKAIWLGIEALKGIKEVRDHYPYLRGFPLPGETEE